MTTMLPGDDWVPEACTLPTVDQPLRRAEFDTLFSNDVIAVHLDSAHRVTLELRPEPEVASTAGALAVKETGCCAFFTFGLTIGDGALCMTVEAASPHEAVLAALGARARGLMQEAS